MENMNVRDVVSEWLEGEGYEGLYNECGDVMGCGCILDDLMPCTGDQSSCEPAYVFFCERCGKASTCNEREEDCEWLCSTDKDFCSPVYSEPQPPHGAAQPAPLPACEPMTVGQMFCGIDYAQGPDSTVITDGSQLRNNEISAVCPHCLSVRLHMQNEQDCAGKMHWFVMCDECGATGSICDTREAALASWNNTKLRVEDIEVESAGLPSVDTICGVPMSPVIQPFGHTLATVKEVCQNTAKKECLPSGEKTGTDPCQAAILLPGA